mmetsp:Transcript_20266/g.49699  ORF Transcript_20266/g.49699 Transcript_20266/m.49699 type:complete len:269 (-) Transcript_20266:59-865(-)
MHQVSAMLSDLSEESKEPSTYVLAQLNFPGKLDRILNTPEFDDIISWMPHGRSWRVMQQKRFEKEVLPVFFRHGNYSSFIRQVNGWGFRRIQSGPDFNSYYHESFLRDDRESHRRMKRPTAKEIANRKKHFADSPPNFYLMAPVLKPNKTEDTAAQATPTSQELYSENLVRKLSHCSMEGKRLVLLMELNRLDSQRSRVLAALQAVEPKSISAGASPLLSETRPYSLKVPHASFTTDSMTMDSMMQLRAAREIFLQREGRYILPASYV